MLSAGPSTKAYDLFYNSSVFVKGRHQKETRQGCEKDTGLYIRHKVIRPSLPKGNEVIADIGHGEGFCYALKDFRQLVCLHSHHARQDHHHKVNSHADSEGNAEFFKNPCQGICYD